MKRYKADDLLIYVSQCGYLNSNTYIMCSGNIALMIDPQETDDVKKLFSELKISEVDALLTHEHFDHTTGLPWLKENYKTTVICQKDCSDNLKEQSKFADTFMSYMYINNKLSKKMYDEFKKKHRSFDYKGDVVFEREYEYYRNNYKFKFISAPGHSKGSCLIILNDSIIFSGDTILKNLPIVTRLPGGSKKEYGNTLVNIINKLDKNCIVLPGHGNRFLLNTLTKNEELMSVCK